MPATLLRSPLRFAGDLARAGDVARVLAKYGLAGWLSEFELGAFGKSLKSQDGAVLTEQSFEARVRLALTDLGTTFIKLGQMLSTRPHLVGEALAAELGKLRESTPADPPAVALATVETEFGRPIDECFREFDGAALASASIAQAHRAHLKTGKRALVKVQHPGIEGTIRRDLDILQLLAELAEKNEYLRRYQPVSLIREFTRTTLRELDFRRELRNLQAFRRNFADDPTVIFPRPHPELTTGRVLTMEFLKGVSVADVARLEKLGIDRQEIARIGADVFIKMIFRDGFYHADPHPGNLLVMSDGRIGLVDAGMVGRIDEEFRKRMEDLLLAIGENDAPRLTDAIIEICSAPPGLDHKALGAAVSDFLEEFGSQDLGQFNMSGALGEISRIIHEYRLIMPGKLSMLIRCLVVLEGTGRLLSPAFNLVEMLQPWQGKILRQRLSLSSQLRNLRRLYADWERIAEAAPRFAMSMMDRLDAGSFVFRLEHRDLNSSVNRLVAGLLISSLLLSSAVLLAHSIGPLKWGYSVLGIIGYAIAILFGIKILWTGRFGRRGKDR
ncbi:MAG TPA: AarF/ABC1/UbiB kinase family protein [Tepidisphaeraceae bacterium]|jgi:ubiquinone biosynthesis protein|nr:AarF/ABC1/UbiB kinase family protein [Tepidisphaeraceae bacterium]